MPLGGALVVVPIYTFEKIAEYFYLIDNQQVFFIFSGYRWYFDMIWGVSSAFVLGLKFRTIGRAWVTYLLSMFVLVSLFFAVCDPRLCYSTGTDGFEWLRMGSFLAAVGFAAAYLGYLRRGGPNSNKVRLLAGGCVFYALAYNHVIFTMAGVRMTPFEPVGTLAFLGILSFVVTLSQGESRASLRTTSTMVPQAVLLALGAGMAWQYAAQTFAFVGPSLATVAFGTILGIALDRGGLQFIGSLRRSRLPIIGLVLFVLLTTVVILPDAVVGQVSTASNPGVSGSYSVAIPQYVGGFLPGPDVSPRSTAVGVNVSIPVSDLSSLEPGNVLAGGIGVHSADCCTDGIDYGFRFDLVLAANGSESLVGSAWRICDTNAACGGHSWKTLMYYFSSEYSRTKPGESVRLRLEWENRTVVWQAASGSDTQVFGSFAALPHMNAAFNVGTWGSPGNPYFGGAFFQFGVTTLRLPSGSWAVTLTCPSIFYKGIWNCVDHAKSIQGGQSTWKVLWRWGETFPNVAAAVDTAGRSVTFHNSSSTMTSLLNFW